MDQDLNKSSCVALSIEIYMQLEIAIVKVQIYTIFIIMKEFHDFEKIQIRSSHPDLYYRLGNWNLQKTITYSNFVQTGHMRCFLTSIDSIDLWCRPSRLNLICH